MKICELYKARYSDGRTVYEKPLDWIYSHQNGAAVEITPTIWIWKASTCNVYFVDYMGDGVGCTLATFDSLTAAQEYREQIGAMTADEFTDWLINVHWTRQAASTAP